MVGLDWVDDFLDTLYELPDVWWRQKPINKTNKEGR